MKRGKLFFMAAGVFALSLVFLSGCGKTDSAKEEAPQYENALEVLNTVVKAYEQEDLFAMYGGNQENAVMDEPGKFDISKTDELVHTLGLPKEQAAEIDDAASMVHMMNTNTFTGAAYHLKDEKKKEEFAEAVKSNLLANQWVCGQPDTVLILDVGGGYVITAYGQAEIMKLFLTNATNALSGATVLVEAPIG